MKLLLKKYDCIVNDIERCRGSIPSKVFDLYVKLLEDAVNEYESLSHSGRLFVDKDDAVNINRKKVKESDLFNSDIVEIGEYCKIFRTDYDHRKNKWIYECDWIGTNDDVFAPTSFGYIYSKNDQFIFDDSQHNPDRYVTFSKKFNINLNIDDIIKNMKGKCKTELDVDLIEENIDYWIDRLIKENFYKTIDLQKLETSTFQINITKVHPCSISVEYFILMDAFNCENYQFYTDNILQFCLSNYGEEYIENQIYSKFDDDDVENKNIVDLVNQLNQNYQKINALDVLMWCFNWKSDLSSVVCCSDFSKEKIRKLDSEVTNLLSTIDDNDRLGDIFLDIYKGDIIL